MRIKGPHSFSILSRFNRLSPRDWKKKTQFRSNTTLIKKPHYYETNLILNKPLLAKMTAVHSDNKQDQFYRKQARLTMKLFKFLRVRDKINRERESLTYVTTQFPTILLCKGCYSHKI